MHVLLFEINLENNWTESLVEYNCALKQVISWTEECLCIVFRMVLKRKIFEIFAFLRKNVKQTNIYRLQKQKTTKINIKFEDKSPKS
jgi:hypothetical protein